MTVILELSVDDARCLRDHLARHVTEVDDEQAHTERRQLRHALAVDADRLRLIQGQLTRVLAGAA